MPFGVPREVSPMPITARTVRYIKLGRGGRWEKISLERGELHFGGVGQFAVAVRVLEQMYRNRTLLTVREG